MFKFILTFLISIQLTGCGSKFWFKQPKPTPIAGGSLIQQKSDLYSELVKNHQDIYGFIMTEECDSLLFSGLLSASLPGTVSIPAAQNSKGEWHRRPTHDCGPSFNNSRSSISRDMILGLFWHLWRNKDLELANQLMIDLRKNSYWLKGEGTIGELLVIPAYLNTLALIIKGLGGQSYIAELLMPAIFSKTLGFRAHLTTWHILLRSEIAGKLSSHSFYILKYFAEHSPKNPLFQAAYHKWLDGDQSNSVQLLMDNLEWPNDRLPSSNEHCAPWPVQREYKEKDWGPCPDYREHSGAELITVYRLIIQ